MARSLRRLTVGVTTTSLVAFGMIGPGATSASAASVSLTTTAWLPTSVGHGVVPEQVALLARGGGGGHCVEFDSRGGVVWGALQVSDTDSLTGVPGMKGGACGSPTAGTGGAGAFSGGDGSVGVPNSGWLDRTQGGAGGGGSAGIYLNGSGDADLVAVAGGGGGASGGSQTSGSMFSENKAGGPGSQSGNSGQEGATDGVGGIPGQAGAVGADAKTDGANGIAADFCTSVGSCGGTGGGGGGSLGSNQAVAGGSDSGTDTPFAASGGSGAGGVSTGTLADIEYGTAFQSADGATTLYYVDITAGDVDDVTTKGDPYTGTAYAADLTSHFELVGVEGTDYPTGLLINSTTGDIAGTSENATDGTYQVKVRATATADGPQVYNAGPPLYLNGKTVKSVKTITMTVGSTPPPDIEPPYVPRNLKVSGGPKARVYRVSWSAPRDPDDNRPVSKYWILVNQVRRSNNFVDRFLPSSRTKYPLSRKFLLSNAVLPRGDISGPVRFRVRVFAINSAGRSPVSTAYLRVQP